MSNSRFTIFILVIVVLAALAGGFLWWRGGKAQPQPTVTPTPTVTVTPTPTASEIPETAAMLIEEGKVQLTHESKDAMVEDQAEVFVGDKIKTFADSRATLIFPDNDVLRLDTNTEITILTLVSSDTDAKVKIEQSSGQTWSRVESILDKKREYSVETATLVATVRGTVFSVDSATADESWVGVSESTVDVERKEDKNILPVHAGDFASVKKGVRGRPLAKMLAQKLDDNKLGSDWFKNNSAKDQKIKDFLTKSGKKKLEKNFLRRNYKMFFEKILKNKLDDKLTGTELPTTGVFDPKMALHFVLTGFVAEKKATQDEANTMETDPYAQERVKSMKNNIEIATFVTEYLRILRANTAPTAQPSSQPSPEPTTSQDPQTQPTFYFDPQYFYFTPSPTPDPVIK